MKKQTVTLALSALLLSYSFTTLADAVYPVTYASSRDPESLSSSINPLSADYGQLPLSFELNQGQSDDPVKFLSRGLGYSLFLTPTEAVMSLAKTPQSETDVIRMQLIGANTKPEMEGLERLPGTSNYFTGTDSKQWHSDVPHYAQVKYTRSTPASTCSTTAISAGWSTTSSSPPKPIPKLSG